MNMNSSQVILNTREDNSNVSNFPESTNYTSSTPSPYDYYYIICDDFYFYGLSVVIPCGLIGNFFSICVFLLSSILRRTTTGQYLVALAIADSTVLVGEVLRWLSYYTNVKGEYYLHSSLGLNIFDTSSVACKMTYFLRYGGGLSSVWITTAIAFQRFITVAFPSKIDRFLTLRASRVVILIIAIISCSLALFSFWHFEIQFSENTPQCKISGDEGYQTWNTVTLKFGTLIIPGVLITILTVAIIVVLYRARNHRKSQLTVSEESSPKGCSKLGFSTETQLTIMLLAVCIATTALKGPYMIAYYLRTKCWGKPPCNSLIDMQTYVAYRVTDVFNIVNYAVNFILYCMSSSSFRQQIKETVCRRSKAWSACDSQQINLEALSPPSAPPLGSKDRLLKHNSKANPSEEAGNI